MDDESKLRSALALAELGFRVFPLAEGEKTPAIDAWQKRATVDPEHIRRWWVDPVTGWEQGYNIGIACGHGIAVVDVDNKDGKNGDASLRHLSKGRLHGTVTSRTPTGGLHMIFATGAEDVGNSAGKLGEGLDIRGLGGYIVGPGSVVAAGAYAWAERKAPGQHKMTKLPDWLRELCTRPKTHTREVAPGIELDTPAAMQRAIDYLATAPEAVEGAGGDETAYKVAARIRDLGLSEGECLSLLLDHWNQRCSPPWELHDLERKVRNAYTYGQNAPGTASPTADFEPVAPTQAAAPPLDDALAPIPLTPFLPADLPPREWLLGKLLMAGNVTVLVAPPGVGKSTLVVGILLALASGRSDIVAADPAERMRSWYFNNEDDREEIMRRLSAAMQHHKLTWRDVADKDGKPYIHLNDGSRRPLLMAKRTGNGQSVKPADRDALIAYIRAHRIRLFVADPFIETHEGDENSNSEMGAVARMYRDVAKATGCAVLLVHHTRKLPAGTSDGHAGNMDSGRGAGALMGVARIAITLYGMSAKDAKDFGVREKERHLYVRLDSAKGNMSLTTGKSLWFRRVSVPLVLGRHPTDSDFLDAEEIGVLQHAPRLTNDTAVTPEEIRDAIGAPFGQSKTISLGACARNILDANPLYSGFALLTMASMVRRAIPGSVVVGDRELRVGYDPKERRKLVVTSKPHDALFD